MPQVHHHLCCMSVECFKICNFRTRRKITLDVGVEYKCSRIRCFGNFYFTYDYCQENLLYNKR